MRAAGTAAGALSILNLAAYLTECKKHRQQQQS